MNDLVTTISRNVLSTHLRDKLNEFRKEAGEKEIRLNKFNEKLIDELEGEHYTKRVVQNSNNTESTIYEITQDQCILIGMRESKAVRRQVLGWIHTLDSAQVPSWMVNLSPQAVLAIEDLNNQLEVAKPKLEYHDKVLAAPNGLTTSEIAAELGMSAQKLNKLLKDMKVQKKIGQRWVLTAANLGQGYETEETFLDDGGVSRHSMKWKEAGRKFIHELVGDEK